MKKQYLTERMTNSKEINIVDYPDFKNQDFAWKKIRSDLTESARRMQMEGGITSKQLREALINVLLPKIDEAVDDMENGMVQSVEDVWKEVDAI